MKYLLLSFVFFVSQNTYAAEVCSRVATINYQKILTDAGSTGKGEGLRHYLEKDPKARALLNQYQQNTRPSWISAGLSTVGSMMAIYGMLSGDKNGSGLSNRNNLVIGGASMVLISYLTSSAMKHNNEYLLERAVDEYNKRNRPQIFFSPFKTESGIAGGIQIRKGF